MENFYAELSRTNIFNGLKEDDIVGLLQDKPFRIKEFTRDEYIAYSHDICYDMIFVVKGSVRDEMTDFSGVTRPSLARALAEMEEEGIIRAERREITILNKEKLNKLLNN